LKSLGDKLADRDLRQTIKANGSDPRAFLRPSRIVTHCYAPKIFSNMLIIDRLELRFQPGLKRSDRRKQARAKSILLDSLDFVLGIGVDVLDLVRQGAFSGPEVTAWFDLPEGHAGPFGYWKSRTGRGERADPAPINGSDGRKTAWVNDRRLFGRGCCARCSEGTLVELHGQA